MVSRVVQSFSSLGWWSPNGIPPLIGDQALKEALHQIHQAFYLVENEGAFAVGKGGLACFGGSPPSDSAFPILAFLSPCRLENLGDRTFCTDHRIRYPYLAGAMANGIGSVEIIEAMAKEGMLAFFGAAGLSLSQIESAIDRITKNLGRLPYGFNLIHSPQEPELEAAVVDLYLRRGISLVEASAYLDLTLPLVRYRVHGIHRDDSGKVITPHRIIAKVSRVEVASKFFSPPPETYLRHLVSTGEITEEQALLAKEIPMAQDLTAEADSGGHTDNRPAITLIPTMLALRDQLQCQYRFSQSLRVGAAGGIATPFSAAAAFSMGAAYILTGSINQSTVEAGTSDSVREMLAQAGQADIAMAPAADMFEMGVKVQVLKRGTMFAMRAAKLYETYHSYGSLSEIPAADRAQLEKNTFRSSFEEVWRQTREYFLQHEVSHIEKAERDPKHKMALVFRWYLGQTSHWANGGDPTRKIDYQIWCGPAMGAFNSWVKGSFLELPSERRVVTLALNLLYGAAIVTRINHLRSQGVPIAPEWMQIPPQDLNDLKKRLE